MDKKLIKAQANFMRKNGIKVYDPTTGYMEIFETKTSKEPSKYMAKKSAEEPISTTDNPNAQMPSESDLLFWSTPSFDVTTETRKDDTPR